MILRLGGRSCGTVSGAQLVVVQAPSAEIVIGCGGVPMAEDDGHGLDASLDASLGERLAIGQR